MPDPDLKAGPVPGGSGCGARTARGCRIDDLRVLDEVRQVEVRRSLGLREAPVTRNADSTFSRAKSTGRRANV